MQRVGEPRDLHVPCFSNKELLTQLTPHTLKKFELYRRRSTVFIGATSERKRERLLSKEIGRSNEKIIG